MPNSLSLSDSSHRCNWHKDFVKLECLLEFTHYKIFLLYSNAKYSTLLLYQIQEFSILLFEVQIQKYVINYYTRGLNVEPDG